MSVNAEYARQEEIFHSDREKSDAEMMSNPLTNEEVFSYLGFLLGAFPPAAIFSKWIIESGKVGGDEIGILLLLAVVNIVSAITGYFTGKLVGKVVLQLENVSWHRMILALPLVGLLWGIISGGAGGIFIFIIGAIFGAMIGGLVGSLALPAFTIFHRLFKRGDKLEMNLFLPMAFGITFIISALILGA